MADCVSLPNAAELVDLLRRFEERYVSEVCGVSLFCNCLCENEDCIVIQAADAIEQLLAENARLKAERDAAIDALRYDRSCLTCKYHNTATCGGCHIDKDRWEWRGVQGCLTE